MTVHALKPVQAVPAHLRLKASQDPTQDPAYSTANDPVHSSQPIAFRPIWVLKMPQYNTVVTVSVALQFGPTSKAICIDFDVTPLKSSATRGL